MCGSLSAFLSTQGVKGRHTIFHARVGLVRFPLKHAGTRYAELVFLHRMRTVGLVVNSGVSGARNVDVLFFLLGWDQYIYHKKHGRTRYAKLVFLHLVRSVGPIVNSRASTARNVNALCFMLG
jgi:hypothetical protein